MLSKFKLLFFSDTAKDSFILTFSYGLSAVINFFILIILTRSLNVFDFGLFITALTFAQLVLDLSEMGIGAATLRFVGSTSGQERIKVIKQLFLVRISISAFAAVVIYLLSWQIAHLVLNSSSIVTYVQLSALGAFLMALIFWGQTVFQAQKQIHITGIINLFPNILRFLLLLILLLTAFYTAFNVYLGFQLVLILVLLIVFGKMGISFLKVPLDKDIIGNIIKFSLPIGLSYSFFAIYSKLDQLLVLQFRGADEAGLYGLAFRLTTILILISTAFNNAIAPRFVAISNTSFKQYFKLVLLVDVVIGVLALLAIPLAPFLIPLIFGENFTGSVLAFQILLVATVIYILSTPFNYAILYRFKNAHFALWTSIIYFILTYGALTLLIPRFGIVGAGIAIALVNSLQLLIAIIFFVRIKSSQ